MADGEEKIRGKWVTTSDNPYDYWNDFLQWYNYDTEKGYNTCDRVARLLEAYSDEFSEEDETRAINAAVDKVIAQNITGLYILTLEPEEN